MTKEDKLVELLEIQENYLARLIIVFFECEESEKIKKSKYADSYRNIVLFLKRFIHYSYSLKILYQTNFEKNSLGISLINRSIVLDILLIKNIYFHIGEVDQSIKKKKINDYLNSYANSDIEQNNEFLKILIENADNINKYKKKHIDVKNLKTKMSTISNKELKTSANSIAKNIFKKSNNKLQINETFRLFDIYTQLSKVEHFSLLSDVVLNEIILKKRMDGFLLVIGKMYETVNSFIEMFHFIFKIKTTELKDVNDMINIQIADVESTLLKWMSYD